MPPLTSKPSDIMQETVTVTMTCGMEGEFFVAVSPQFPGMKWIGETEQEAHDFFWNFVYDRLGTSRANEALKQHPLWPTIQAWCEATTGPAMPWMPPHEFQAALKSLGFDPFQNRCIQQTYDHAEILRRALVGGDYDATAHEILYRSAGHDLGFAFCFAAGIAYRIDCQQQAAIDAENKERQAKSEPLLPACQVFADFAGSTRLDGFAKELEAWAPFLVQEHFDGKVELGYVIREFCGKDEDAANFWLDACKRQIGNTVEFGKVFAQEVVKAQATERTASNRAKKKPKEYSNQFLKETAERVAKEKKPKRGRKKGQYSAEFKHLLKCYWLPMALWCKPPDVIVGILAPGRKENFQGMVGRVRRDIPILRKEASEIALENRRSAEKTNLRK